jgi:hypothetical protein
MHSFCSLRSSSALLAATLLFTAGPATAQLFSVGLKGGIPLTDAVDGSYGVQSKMKRYVVGPMVEIKLPFSFALEADALYRRTGYNSTFSGLQSTGMEQLRANSWEFPLLAKYYFTPRAPLRLYVSGGYVARRLSGIDAVIHSFGTDVGTGLPFDITYNPVTTYLLQDNPTHGVAIGGGARLHAGFLRISPEIRYTHWGGAPFNTQGSRGYFVTSTENQLDVLIGLSF